MTTSWTTRRAAAAPYPSWGQVGEIPLFSGLPRRDVLRVLSQAQWFCLPGGWTLLREGDPAHAVHVVLAGRLGALVNGPDGGREAIGEVGAGEIVGEMAMLSGMPRSATLVALRDTELLRLPRSVFEELLHRHPRTMRQVGRVLAERLNHAAHPKSTGAAPKTIAVVPLTADQGTASLAGHIARNLMSSGRRCVVVGPQHARQPVDWFHKLEAGHDLVVYEARNADSTWAKQCLRQADRVVFAAAADEIPPPHVMPTRACDLVLLYPSGATRPRNAAPWLAAVPATLHSHVRLSNRNDLGCLVRLLTGRAIGLVLSGGGARAFAHFGVIRALREAGVPIDIVGGTSMGAIAAAGVAMEWSAAEFEERMKRCFVETNPLADVTLPLVSLTAGQRVTRRLQRHFGDFAIENLWRPYFAVSANLTTGRQLAHRNGPLWRALRASVAIPGLLPPIIEDGEVLVDGGTLNNFPVDALASMRRGPIIGSDVGRVRCVGDCGTAPALGPVSRLLRKWRGGAPGIVELLMRAATVSSDARAAESRREVDLLFEPPVASFDLRDWNSFDRIVEVGYRHATDVLRRGGAERIASRSVTTA